jgi:hypothetical protein
MEVERWEALRTIKMCGGRTYAAYAVRGEFQKVYRISVFW